MILKPSKNTLIPTNHRPISLLNAISNVFEVLLLNRLKKSVSNTIRPEEIAFRRGHSTTLQLTGLLDNLVDASNKKVRTPAVFLDFEKAFDKVWHQGLLSKLVQANISPQLINILRSFLSDRSFSVRSGDSLSSPRTISAGMPFSTTLHTLHQHLP